MILTCPACATRYLVPDTAIGPTGRQVRCAACRHSWFEAPGDAVSAADVAAPAEAEAGAPADAARVYGEGDPGYQRSTRQAWSEAADFRPRRNPARMWTIAAAAAAVLLLAALAAVLVFGPPRLRGLYAGDHGGRLDVQVTKFDRRKMESGNELLEVTGRVLNPTATRQPVPDIHAELHDRSGRIVYDWTIARPTARLEPGASIDFDSAAVDVPRGAAELKLSLAGTAGR